MITLAVIIFGAVISSIAVSCSIRWCYDNDECCPCCYKEGHVRSTKGERLPQTSVYVRDESLEDHDTTTMGVEA